MPTDYMIALGDYRFSVDTAAYQELARSTAYRWQSADRVGRLPAMQYTGPGADTIRLNGVVYPSYAGGLHQVDAMREQAGTGEPLRMVDGQGRHWGNWVITQISETQTEHWSNGAPRKIAFALALTRYGDDGENANVPQPAG